VDAGLVLLEALLLVLAPVLLLYIDCDASIIGSCMSSYIRRNALKPPEVVSQLLSLKPAVSRLPGKFSN